MKQNQIRKVGYLYVLISLSLFLKFNPAVQAGDEFKITAHIIDMFQVCYLTGTVRDAAGNGVHPAEVTLACGSIVTKASTLQGGAYIANPPPCIDFTITATAAGWNPVSQSRLEVSED